MLLQVLHSRLTAIGPRGFLLLLVNLTNEPTGKVAEHQAGDTTHHRDGYSKAQTGAGAVVGFHGLYAHTFEPLLALLLQSGQQQVALHQGQQLGQAADVLHSLLGALLAQNQRRIGVVGRTGYELSRDAAVGVVAEHAEQGIGGATEADVPQNGVDPGAG